MGKKCCILISGTSRLYDKYLINFINKVKETNNLEVVDVILSLNCEYIDQDIVKLLNPKKIYYAKVELPDKFLNVNKNSGTNLLHTYSMYFNNYKAFKLLEEFQIENDFEYDYIIKYRSDLHSTDQLKLLNEQGIFIPVGNDHTGINDQVAYGNFISMKKYCYMYEDLDNMIFTLKIIFHPETLLHHHLLNYNIKRFSYHYSIQRQ
jgi:hypothetical protein